MSILFSPNGNLDVATDPSDLPEERDGATSVVSGAMQRCKNLDLDRMGIASTRKGTSKVNSTAIATAIHRIVEQGGSRFAFAGSIIYENESSIATGLTKAEWSAIKYNAFNDTTQDIFALNGTDRKRIENSSVYEWGIAAPSTAPAIVSSPYACSFDWELDEVTNGFLWFQEGTSYNYLYDWEGQQLAGSEQQRDALATRGSWVFEIETSAFNEYKIKYTYVRKSGATVICESNPSPALTMTMVTRAAWMVSWTASGDGQVTHVRLYRTLAGASTYYYDREVAIGTTQIALIKQDSELSSTTVSTDHDRPPLGGIALGPDFNGVCFILKDNRVYFSLAKRPEYFPAAQYVEAGSLQHPLKAGVFWNAQLYVLNKPQIYMVQGTGVNSFFPVPMSAATGTRGQNAVLGVRGLGIFHLGADGIYLFDGTNDRKITDQHFQPIFQGKTTNGIPGMNLNQLDECIMVLFNSKLWFGYPGGTNSKPSDFLITDLTTMRTEYFTYGVNFTALVVDETNDRLLAGDTSGYIWELENRHKTTDGTTAIAWEIESKAFTLQTRNHFPRWGKWDVDASGATTATGSIVLDGVVHQNHTLTGDRDTTKRLVETGNGKRCSMRISGTGPVEIFASEME